MRKQTKLVAVLSAAALLAVGASMTSFAATRNPWVDLGDGDWAYVNSDGERVTNEWRRNGSDYFFLDENGVMARSRLITPDDGDSDSYYYVGGTGARLKNQWVRVMNDEQDTVNDQTPEMFWYYLGTNGKAVKADDDADFKKTSINYNGSNRLFFFDSEGRMVTGWIEYKEKDDKVNMYYADPDGSINGAEGAAVTGWVELEVPDDWDSSGSKEYDVVEWFFFDGGKMKKGTEGKPLVWYNSGWYYSFDENGVLLDDWYKVDATGTTNNLPNATSNNLEAFTTYVGTKGTGWIYNDKNDDGDYKYYYLVAIKEKGSDGKEKTVRNVAFNSLGNDKKMRAKTINGKVYLFDTDGIMQTGVKDLTKEGAPKDDLGGAPSKGLDPGYYFFNNGSSGVKGQMMTGKQTVLDDGETNTYYFYKETGKAATNAVIDGYIYGNDGKRIEAENGNTYEIITLPDGADVQIMSGKTVKDTIPAGSKVIVSSNGKLKTSISGFTKIDGEQYKVVNNKDGSQWDVITKEDYENKTAKK